jgi:hypothetical protein
MTRFTQPCESKSCDPLPALLCTRRYTICVNMQIQQSKGVHVAATEHTLCSNLTGDTHCALNCQAQLQHNRQFMATHIQEFTHIPSLKVLIKQTATCSLILH